jgi:hypothetical protein
LTVEKPTAYGQPSLQNRLRWYDDDGRLAGSRLVVVVKLKNRLRWYDDDGRLAGSRLVVVVKLKNRLRWYDDEDSKNHGVPLCLRRRNQVCDDGRLA